MVALVAFLETYRPTACKIVSPNGVRSRRIRYFQRQYNMKCPGVKQADISERS